MNTIVYLALIVSLTLLLGGEPLDSKRMKGGSSPEQGKIVLNHNETLVKDDDSVGKRDLPRIRDVMVDDTSWIHPSTRNWQASRAQSAGSVTFEVGKSAQSEAKESWIATVWDFFFRGTQQPPGGDCDEFGCGGNHNETLVRDVERATPRNTRIPQPPVTADTYPRDWNSWTDGYPIAASIKVGVPQEINASEQDPLLNSIWDFFFRGTQQPPGGDCDEFGCGSNHNETLVKDAGHVEPTRTRTVYEPETSSVDTRNGDPLANWVETDGKIEAAQDIKATPQDSWLQSIWDLFFRGGQQPPGGDCDEFGCGTNHNETLVQDVFPPKTDTRRLEQPPIDYMSSFTLDIGDRSDRAGEIKIEGAHDRQDSWMKTVWDFLFRGTQQPPGGDCDEFGCGMNHNETVTNESLLKGGNR